MNESIRGYTLQLFHLNKFIRRDSLSEIDIDEWKKGCHDFDEDTGVCVALDKKPSRVECKECIEEKFYYVKTDKLRLSG